jgi:3-oxoacyl-[acyl-carrier protein] reductase
MMRRVLVTGGSRGIGRAAALRLAVDGFHVTLNYRSRTDEAEKAAEEIRATGGAVKLLPFDVADRQQSRSLLETEIGREGAYYGVFLNAGVRADGPFPGLGDEAWDRVLRTNLDGFYNVLHPLVMPMIRLRQGGRIVIMSSVAGVVGNRGQVNYSASKAGLIGATRSLALELAKRKITVNAVAPGLIETDMIEGTPVQEMAKMIPMQRLGRPEEVAAVVSFLCSDDASYLTGQTISINGGMA